MDKMETMIFTSGRLVEPKQDRMMQQTKATPRSVDLRIDGGRPRRGKMPHPRNSPCKQRGAMPCRRKENSVRETHTTVKDNTPTCKGVGEERVGRSCEWMTDTTQREIETSVAMAVTLLSISKPRTLRLAKTHTRASRKVCTRAKVERNEVRRHGVAKLASRTVAVGLAAWTCTGVAQAATGATSTSATGWVQSMIGFLLHLDVHLSSMIARYGAATYAILFAIVFCETGLVVTPFLPGDSLLFAAGAFSAMGSLNLGLLIGTLFVAAVLGDTVNYALGAWLGKKALDSNFIKNEYIEKTEGFYNKYGGKTVVLARFVPIVRTFAPFVAGIGSMYYSKFFFYNVVGGAIWTILFTLAGFFFGNLPFVQHNFTLVVLAIIALSVVPVLVEVYQASKETKVAGRKLSKEDQI